MEYIQVTRENIEKEHICCAISNNKDVQVSSKKEWMNKCPFFNKTQWYKYLPAIVKVDVQ